MNVLFNINKKEGEIVLDVLKKETAPGFGKEAGIINKQNDQAKTHFTLPYFTQTLLHKFCILAETWKEETKLASISPHIVLNPSYQQIIGMGLAVVPYILEYMRIEENYWFWALKAITGEDPVNPQDRGNITKMTQAWLDWGIKNGHII